MSVPRQVVATAAAVSGEYHLEIGRRSAALWFDGSVHAERSRQVASRGRSAFPESAAGALGWLPESILALPRLRAGRARDARPPRRVGA